MKFSFLLYDSRSGSTLFSALLNRYRGISVSHETGFIPIVLEYEKDIINQTQLDELLSLIENEVQYSELGIDQKQVRETINREQFPISKNRVIEVILEIYFKQRDSEATLRVVKSPRLFHHLDTLIKLFPDVSFIHIIRDGRAVFNSKRTMVSINGIKTQSNLIKAAFEWKRKMRKSKAMGSRVLEVKYETLVESPDQAMKNVLDYYQLDEQSRELTKEQSVYSSRIGDKQKHLHENVKNKPEQSRINYWRDSLSSSDIALYEIIAGRELQKRGYELVNPDISACALFTPNILLRVLFYMPHQLVIYARNIWWHTFVDKSIGRKIKSKIYEIKSGW